MLLQAVQYSRQKRYALSIPTKKVKPLLRELP